MGKAMRKTASDEAVSVEHIRSGLISMSLQPFSFIAKQQAQGEKG